jgi:2-methylcitrate dehydratase PrpD
LLDGLGERFESRDIFVKPYPCCALAHPFIDAALDLVRDGTVSPDDIVAIDIRRGKGADLVCLPTATKQQPRNVVDAQFSAFWGVAAALGRGRVTLDAYTEQALEAADLRRLSAIATIAVDPLLARKHGVEPAVIVVLLRDGRRLRAASEATPTTPQTSPLANAIGKLDGRAGAAEIIDAVMTLEAQPDLRRLTAALFRPRT